MKKIILASLITFLLTAYSNAECPLVNVPLNERVAESEWVIEATVISKESYYNVNHDFIYTAHTLRLHKIFKGNLTTSQIVMITEGGIVDNEMLQVSPNLETQLNQTGVFFLSKNISWDMPIGVTQSFYSKTGPLGFIYYSDGEAFDLKNRWYNVEEYFTPKLVKITGDFTEITPIVEAKIEGFRRNTPSISSFTPSSIPAGTKQILEIRGSNFGTNRGTGKVQFRNADDGGSSYIDAIATDYISWTDTLIRMHVLRRAGTGTVRVTNNSGNSIVSGFNITIPWAHLNVETGTPARSYETRMTGTNGMNGLSWKWDNNFISNMPAAEAFIRALETWRCNTLINWDTSGRMNNDTNLRDNHNMVFWDKGWLPSSTLGVCYSWYSGCGMAPNMNWYVAELDIVFRKTANWHFGTNNPSGGKFDLESVALHELGHGHQLGHVINTTNVMNYNIGPNTTRRSLQANDTACGNYIMNKSVSAVCSRPIMNKINQGDCQLSSFFANFEVNNTQNICKFSNVTFSNTSATEATSWSWNFGQGANPPTATGVGPHTVSYSTGGAKTISLEVGNGLETRTAIKSNYITIIDNQKPEPDFDIEYRGGFTYFFQNTSVGTGTITWNFGDGSPTTGAFSPTHTYSQDPKDYTVSLVISNSCGLGQKQQLVGDFTSVSNFNSGQNWRFYPNPVSDILFISTDNIVNQSAITIQIFDLQGRIVSNKTVVHQESIEIDCKQLIPGMYYVKLHGNNTTINQSFIKQ